MCVANDSVFVNRHDDSNRPEPQNVQRIMQDWPVKLFPLREEATTFGMLLLNDPYHDEVATVVNLLQCLMPNWHVLSTARSPRREVDKQDLFAAKLR